ncbi:phosphotransferase [Maridesulfovibrio sp.]|uniref:phosphotransferase n=1 Tax=Maridesulfovibrio sp. TaxID=2795000 RepID=UPI002A18725F|nr:phosphotransferase [Maridesulfovibrio sp.]
MNHARELLKMLLGKELKSATRICAGKNSRVYKVCSLCGEVYVAKFYLQPTAEGRSRLEQEWTALKFMSGAGFTDVPSPIGVSEELQGALFSFIEGRTVSEHGIKDIGAVLDFLRRLWSVRGLHGAKTVSPAAEACFSLGELVSNIEQRTAVLMALPCDNLLFEQMHNFLGTDFLMEFEKSVDAARRLLSQPDSEESLAPEYRTLSPSDFGFHNCLRRSGGKLAFLDFEYFGWDDPVKAASDFLLHPAMELSVSEIKVFYSGMKDIFGKERGFENRFRAYLPLFRLKWCLILLNEFLKDGIDRRCFASEVVDSADDMRKAQLDKARTFLGRDRQILSLVTDTL